VTDCCSGEGFINNLQLGDVSAIGANIQFDGIRGFRKMYAIPGFEKGFANTPINTLYKLQSTTATTSPFAQAYSAVPITRGSAIAHTDALCAPNSPLRSSMPPSLPL